MASYSFINGKEEHLKMPKTTKSVFSDEKFSFTAYSHQWKAGRVKSQRPSTVNKDKQTVAGSLKKYQRLIDDIRSELVQLQGRTEEEQKQNSELINRAVLGFEEERLMLLAMIQDMLIQKRVHDEVPPERSTYHTLAEAVFAEVIGLNVLELVLKAKEQLEEVQVVGPLIYEVKGGIERLSPFRFDSIQDVERIQQNLVLFNKDVLNQTKRWAEVML